MQRKKVLVVLAAGMATRFGSLKQLNPVTAEGETLLDFSVYDALQAGFSAVVFIIKESMQAEFEAKVAAHWRKHIEVRYAFQDNNKLPYPAALAAERTKPLGTTHALYCAKDSLQPDESFVVVNADDFYGSAAYRSLAVYIDSSERQIGRDCALVPYCLERTLSEEGTVSRGVCELDAKQYLKFIVERTKIKRLPDQSIAYSLDEGESWHPLADDTPVSMNIWAFDYPIFELCTDYLTNFLKNELPLNPLKAESYLPMMVGEALQAGKLSVKALAGGDMWFGLTYKADTVKVEAALAALKADNTYPQNLY